VKLTEDLMAEKQKEDARKMIKCIITPNSIGKIIFASKSMGLRLFGEGVTEAFIDGYKFEVET